MEELISKDVIILITHINYLCSEMGVVLYPNILVDKTPNQVTITAEYLMKDQDKTTRISHRVFNTTHDEYLDNKDMLLKSINFHLYNDILINTQFDNTNKIEEDKYKWN